MKVKLREHGAVECTWYYEIDVPDGSSVDEVLAIAKKLEAEGELIPYDSRTFDPTAADSEWEVGDLYG